jgi:hypothetical protein
MDAWGIGSIQGFSTSNECLGHRVYLGIAPPSRAGGRRRGVWTGPIQGCARTSGGLSGRPATPGICSVRRAKRTSTELPLRPRNDCAAMSPSQPAVSRPSMLSTSSPGLMPARSAQRSTARASRHQTLCMSTAAAGCGGLLPAGTALSRLGMKPRPGTLHRTLWLDLAARHSVPSGTRPGHAE